MVSNKAPKQWCLTENETIGSFENWKRNLEYTLSLDPNFADYLVGGATWREKSKKYPLRGQIADGPSVAENRQRTAQQKVTQLNSNLCWGRSLIIAM